MVHQVLLTAGAVGCGYILLLAAICTEEEIVYSLRLTAGLALGLFVAFLTLGTLDSLVRAVYARL